MTETERLTYALEQMPQAENYAALLRLADGVDRGIRDAEFNFPANVIMWADIHQDGIGHKQAELLRQEAEMAMLQLAFLNVGQNVPCSFIGAAYDQGWRYRIDKGFHKEGL